MATCTNHTARSPLSGHPGDVPHTWIAAAYLLAPASMAASEREATDSMVPASGMPWAWISSGAGFPVKGLPTRYGSLEFPLKASVTPIKVTVGGSLTLPPGGLMVVPPLPGSGAANFSPPVICGGFPSLSQDPATGIHPP